MQTLKKQNNINQAIIKRNSLRDFKMLNEEQLLIAQSLGNQFKVNREQHNLTLNEVSTKLEIRSVLLNDMEKGRFLHLRRGDCLAYAKFIGMDIKEVSDTIESLVSANKTETANVNRLKVYIGAATAIVVAIVVVITLSSSMKNESMDSHSVNSVENDNKLQNDQASENIDIQELDNVATVTPSTDAPKEDLASSVNDSKNLLNEEKTEIESNTIMEHSVNTQNSVDNPEIKDNKVKSGIEIVSIDDGNNQITNKNSELKNEMAQDESQNNKLSKTKDDTKVDISTVNNVENKNDKLVRNEPNKEVVVHTQKVAESKDQSVNSSKPKIKKEVASAPHTTVNSSLKVGQVVSLGSKNNKTVPKKDEKSTNVSSINTNKNQKKLAVDNNKQVNGLKAGEIRPLSNTLKKNENVNEIKVKEKSTSGVAPVTLNKEEIKQKADRVVITEVVAK